MEQITLEHLNEEIKDLKRKFEQLEEDLKLKPSRKEEMSDVMMTMLMSEKALAENWLSLEDEEAWKDL